MKRFIYFISVPFLCFSSISHAETKSMNPNISANILGLFQRGTDLSSNRNDDPRNGIRVQEAEFQAVSDVDPYLKANLILSIHQESGDWKVEPEEAYLETISLPSVTLKAGKYKLAFGKHNQLHTHAFPFIDAPIAQESILGEEGLNESSFSTSVLFPFSWFSELTGQVFDASNDTLFNSSRSGSLGALVRFRNLWDLSDSLTFEWGVSGAKGKNSSTRYATVFGSDLTFKWRPTEEGKYKAFIWSTEILGAKRPGSTDSTSGLDTSHLSGTSTYIQYQIGERWWVQGRLEHLGVFARSEGVSGERKWSALLGFFPSEFSGLRAQYDQISKYGIDRKEHRFSLQYNVSIGAHPAHAY